MSRDDFPDDFSRSLTTTLEILHKLVFLTEAEADDPSEVRRYMKLAQEWIVSMQKRTGDELAGKSLH